MKPLATGLAVAVLLAVAGDALSQDGVLLRYLPSKEPIVLRKVSTTKQVQTVMDKKVTNDISQTEVEVWSIAAKDKKGLEVKAESKRVQVKAKLGGVGDYSFDSKKDDNERDSTLGAALTPVYERLSMATLTYGITERGEVTKFEGLKEALGDLLKDNPIGRQFLAGGSDEAAKLGLAEYFPRMPEKPLTRGERWETPFEFNLDKFGKATGKRLYIFDGDSTFGKHKTAKISVFTELSFELDLDMGGVKVTGTMTVTRSQGTIHFDPKQGRVISLSNEYTISGNLNVSVNGKNIPVSMEQMQQVTLEVLEALPK